MKNEKIASKTLAGLWELTGCGACVCVWVRWGEEGGKLLSSCLLHRCGWGEILQNGSTLNKGVKDSEFLLTPS